MTPGPRAPSQARVASPILYGFAPSSYFQTAALAFREKGAPLQLERLETEEASPPPLLPFDKTPVLAHGGHLLAETLAIGLYADERFEGPPLQPQGDGRYLMLQWISHFLDAVDEHILTASVRERFVRPMSGLPVRERLIREHRPAMRAIVARLDHQLARDGYIVGPRLSLADLFYAPPLLYFRQTPEGADLLEPAAAVRLWLGGMAGRPAVQALCPQAGPA